MWSFAIDDAFNLLRYDRDLSRGFGLTFTAGQPWVEAYSDFTFVIVGAVCHLLGAEGILVVKAVGLSAGLCCIAVAVIQTVRLRSGVPAASLAAILVGISPTFAFWSISGLETASFALLIASGALLLTRASRRSDLIAAAVLFLAVLTRFGAPIDVAGMLVARVVSDLTSGGG
jgi:hypothetical protein